MYPVYTILNSDDVFLFNKMDGDLSSLARVAMSIIYIIFNHDDARNMLGLKSQYFPGKAQMSSGVIKSPNKQIAVIRGGKG